MPTNVVTPLAFTPALAVAPKSKSQLGASPDGRYVHAGVPVWACRATTVLAYGGDPLKSQSAVPNTTRPRSGRTVGDDQTLPQLSSRTRPPLAFTSVWNSHTGSPVPRLAAAT